MTRKHYIAIAKIIKDNTYIVNGNEKVLDKHEVIKSLCKVLKIDNSLFDRQRFINACNDK